MRLLPLALAIVSLSAFCFGQTYTFSTLVNFTGAKKGPQYPSNLIVDSSGNLYGTSYSGGKFGNGTVFKVSPKGVVTVLHSFAGSPSDGALPYDALARDNAGNLYGTTYSGGSVNTCSGRPGCGTVFKVTPSGTETVLHDFADGSDGALPGGTLTLDSAGNVYGIASGTVSVLFKITPSGVFSTIYTFSDYPGFGNALIMNRAGNLFGTDFNGGNGSGTVFEVTPQGLETTLHTFPGGRGDREVNSKLAQDSKGNLYGSVFAGGAFGDGAVFKISTAGAYSELYSFCKLANCADGQAPYGWLTLDSAGNLYGQTWDASVPGVIFKITPSGSESVVYSGIVGTQANQGPALVIDKAGNIYGSIFAGNGNFGSIFKLTKN
jgi:uncharacterized repeat protein (TIGR03803 family)